MVFRHIFGCLAALFLPKPKKRILGPYRPNEIDMHDLRQIEAMGRYIYRVMSETIGEVRGDYQI